MEKGTEVSGELENMFTDFNIYDALFYYPNQLLGNGVTFYQ